MTTWAIVADLNRCVGCQTCTSACKHANATAPGVQWRKVLDFETGEFPTVNRAFLPVGCMHCDEPSCLDACPSTATRKREDGIVTIDYDLCIGCAYCAVSCPYQARFRVDKPTAAYGGMPMRHEAKREDPARLGVAQKCTLCVERIDEGLANGLVPGVDMQATPACVASCISGALQMGDLDDPNSNVSTLLRTKRHFRMHEELGNGPNIYYLYDGEIDEVSTPNAVPMVAEPVGLAAVSPKRQTNWDWRAAANFICGGTGTGLLATTMAAGLFAPVLWPAVLVALAIVASGLFCIWLEIGRPWRFLNVFLNARFSWMTREAMAAVPFFGFGGLSWLLGSPVLGVLGALSGLVFLYCQGRILRAAKGIPAWRRPAIVPLILFTGLAEGAGVLAVLAFATGWSAAIGTSLAAVLLVLVGLRFVMWQRYRADLDRTGAPTGTFQAFDAMQAGLSAVPQGVVAGLVLLATLVPTGQGLLLALAGLGAAVTGWLFKHTLITKAAFTQGYAINRMPARGAGKSSPGVQPGWRKA
ncbi:4Fe-4S dicluster domain-containing protein [Ruegeria marisrubri]|uniref:4Fe-4S dicluster domain-containing protein n=1 Tax=Ruegeria marisrubri TaxID=1685379 RepID=UPI000AEF0F49|nr:4Fe-4S dicluster domain-containing protein [Ruegeria marisrubri]